MRGILSLFDNGEVMGQLEMIEAYHVSSSSSILCISRGVRIIVWIIRGKSRTLLPSDCGNVV